MQQPGQQQAYDRGITIFSPDGRLYQVEYAREAVARGAPSVGVTTEDSVVFAIDTGGASPLIEPSSIEKLHKVDDHIGIASAGHVADGRYLIDFARRHAQVERLRYDEPIGVETVTKTVTDHVQQFTQLGGARPFGAALLLGGIDRDGPRLFEVDPGGAPREWAATAIGRGHEDIVSFLETEYATSPSHDDGVQLALRGLGTVIEGDVDPDRVRVAWVRDPERTYQVVPTGTVAERLAEVGLRDREND